MRSFKAIFALLFCVLSGVSVFAQDDYMPIDSTKRKMFGGAGYITGGLLMQDYGTLNSALQPLSYPGFESQTLMLGGGGFGLIKNFVVGGEGIGLLRQESILTDTGSVSIKGNYGIFQLGYVIAGKKGFYLYPVVGVGGSKMTLNLAPADTTTSFSNVIAMPARSVQLTRKGLLLDFALGMNFTPKGGITGAGGPGIGLRVGYLLSPGDNGWEMNGTELQGSAVAAPGGFYVRLNIGGGGFGRM